MHGPCVRDPVPAAVLRAVFPALQHVRRRRGLRGGADPPPAGWGPLPGHTGGDQIPVLPARHPGPALPLPLPGDAAGPAADPGRVLPDQASLHQGRHPAQVRRVQVLPSREASRTERGGGQG